jgi:hypothetical protein
VGHIIEEEVEPVSLADLVLREHGGSNGGGTEVDTTIVP